jgi:hypothetical protein
MFYRADVSKFYKSELTVWQETNIFVYYWNDGHPEMQKGMMTDIAL